MLNAIMAAAGAAALARNVFRRAPADVPAIRPPEPAAGGAMRWRQVSLAIVLAIPIVIPSDATRDVPETYGARHPGLAHSRLYTPLDPRPADAR